jgi:hypothetical protein
VQAGFRRRPLQHLAELTQDGVAHRHLLPRQGSGSSSREGLGDDGDGQHVHAGDIGGQRVDGERPLRRRPVRALSGVDLGHPTGAEE